MSETATMTAAMWTPVGKPTARSVALVCSLLLHLLALALLLWRAGDPARHIAPAPQLVSVMLLGASAPPTVSSAPSPAEKPHPTKARTQPKPVVSPLGRAAATPVSEPSTTSSAASAPATPAAATPDYTLAAPPPLEYLRRIARIVSMSQKYPWSARESGQQGDVLVRIHLHRDGHVLDVTLIRSSGVASLDEEACNVMRRIARFPPFPADYLPSISEFDIDQPVNFLHYLS